MGGACEGIVCVGAGLCASTSVWLHASHLEHWNMRPLGASPLVTVVSEAPSLRPHTQVNVHDSPPCDVSRQASRQLTQ